MSEFPRQDTTFKALSRTREPESPNAKPRDWAAGSQPTDIKSLREQFPEEYRRYQPRSATDYLIDALTPFMIFVMVYAVIFFLLDVRFVYTEVHDRNFRYVAFFFVMGIVALNRLVAKEGSEESLLYIVVLIGMVGFYTVMTTSAYDVGSVARGFLDRPWVATFFNMAVVIAIWWTTNRLMHECCIDENQTAGEVGILTGTVRRFARKSRVKAPKAKKPPKVKRRKDHLIEGIGLEAFDPTAWKPPEEVAREKADAAPPSVRQPKRHPGISILYFSVPVMLIFTLGYPVLMQGGEFMILAGHFYVGLYTVTALFLLLLTSLGGLREYFRSRTIYFPSGIGWFWVGLGAIMVAAVVTGATRLPKTGLPDMAVIGEHETDFWTRDSDFQLKSSGATAARMAQQSRLVDRVGQGVLIFIGIFLAFGALRSLGEVAAAIGRHRNRFPGFVVRIFEWLDRFLERRLRLPKFPTFRIRRRIRVDLAVSNTYRNPMHGEGVGSGADVRSFVVSSYEALCALAYDLGVPRRHDQTPYEFIESFPAELDGLREEARELTELYVLATYSMQPASEQSLDRLRKFWIAYEKVRQRYIK